MIGGNHQRRYAENLRGGEGMDVVAVAEGFHQQWILRKMRQKSQLNLRVVGGQQDRARCCGECGTNLTAKLGANWNVLQIRVRRRKPSGSSSGLIKGRVQAASRPVQQCRERVDVSRLQFRKL